MSLTNAGTGEGSVPREVPAKAVHDVGEARILFGETPLRPSRNAERVAGVLQREIPHAEMGPHIGTEALLPRRGALRPSPSA